MLINIIAGLLTITGLVFITTEQIFSYPLFSNASTIGFIVIVAGVLLLSFKVAKESRKVETKYYDHFPAGGGPGDAPGGKRHHSDNSGTGDMGGGDFFAGGGGGDGG